MSGKTNGSFSRQIAYTVPVTPSDDTDLALGATRAIILGADGDVAVVYPNGMTDTLVGLLGGVVHPIQVLRIKATGTTATSIKAGY
jgi:hypothetical protein